jgi:hypothetical protein
MVSHLKLRKLMILAVAAVRIASRSAAGTIDQQNLAGAANTPAFTTFGESSAPNPHQHWGRPGFPLLMRCLLSDPIAIARRREIERGSAAVLDQPALPARADV